MLPEGGMQEPTRAIPSSDDPIDCRMVAHDLWPRRLIERREEQPVIVPQRVFWPESDDDVVRVVRSARIERRALVPFGAGSGVCGGVAPTTSTWILDLKRMKSLVALDADKRTCTVEAGMLGERLELALNARGFTLGHFPSSLYCSTIGGWVATRSAGQLSSRYGKVEDFVLGVEGVDGRGDRIAAHVDDPSTGAGAVQLLTGSEGALAVITRATFRIHPLPSHRWLRAFTFETLEAALAAMHALLASGEAPSVLRLYDPLDSALAAPVGVGAPLEPERFVAGGIARASLEDSGPEEAAEEPALFEMLTNRVEELALFSRPSATRRIVGEILGRPQLANAVLGRFTAAPPRLILGVEGDADELALRVPALKKRVLAMGAKDIGDEPGSRWLSHRHRVSYRMSRAFAAGSWIDTMEVATGWQNVATLYGAVREALGDVAVVMCHFSHAYADGCSLYFTFAGGGSPGTRPRSSLSRYDLTWERALTTVRRHGAALSHHHGVGRSKARALRLDPGAMRVLRELKAALDPDSILNPGVLGLGAVS